MSAWYTKAMDKITAKAQILVRKPPSAVFEAFVDAGTMSQFWFNRRDDGLKEGEKVLWYIGEGEDAPAIEVQVKELKKPEILQIEWGEDGQYTQVRWQIEKTADGNAKLSIEESGYTGSYDEIVRQALDSTGGFNQVIVALKALLEHDAFINVVADHV